MWATSSMDYAVDPSPLLTAGIAVGGRPRVARPSLRGAARLLSRASNRHVMREPSLLVREAAAEQLEERQSDWAYSRPVVFLDVLWNLAFVAAAAGVLVLSRKETPVMPLRLWIGGYTLQCVLHIVCVCVQYRRRHLQRGAEGQDGQDGQDGQVQDSSASSSQTDLVEAAGQDQSEQFDGIAKFLESANTMFSFIWWIIGFYWVSVGGQALTNDAPQLYWLCIVFLAFDVFFVVFCVALACVIGIAVCCCLPCIIAILYAVADQQEGASDEEIRQLPSYRFRRICNSEELSDEVQRSLGGVMSDCCSDPPIEHLISDEDAECCICLSAYDDGVELRELPCGHHFHCGCIDKWLYISSTCPLCKYNITSNNNQGREEV